MIPKKSTALPITISGLRSRLVLLLHPSCLPLILLLASFLISLCRSLSSLPSPFLSFPSRPYFPSPCSYPSFSFFFPIPIPSSISIPSSNSVPIYPNLTIPGVKPHISSTPAYQSTVRPRACGLLSCTGTKSSLGTCHDVCATNEERNVDLDDVDDMREASFSS